MAAGLWDLRTALAGVSVLALCLPGAGCSARGWSGGGTAVGWRGSEFPLQMLGMGEDPGAHGLARGGGTLGFAAPAWGLRVLPGAACIDKRANAVARERSGWRGLRAARMARGGGQGGEEGDPLTVRDILREWHESRKLRQDAFKSEPGSSQRPVALLFVSSMCVRALLAEKLMLSLLEQSALREGGGGAAGSERERVQERLLVLSAGLDNEAGAPVGRGMMAAAADSGIDLTEDNPCARFDEADLDIFDLVVCMDAPVRDRVLERAKAFATRNPNMGDLLFVGGVDAPESKYARYEAKILVASANNTILGGDEHGVPKVMKGVKGKAEDPYEGLSKALPRLKEACEWSLSLMLDMGL